MTNTCEELVTLAIHKHANKIVDKFADCDQRGEACMRRASWLHNVNGDGHCKARSALTTDLTQSPRGRE